MTNHDTLCRELQSLWHRDFPISKAMGVRVHSFEEHALTTRTPLAPNTNTHGTAFAGSLYAIEALTAWGVLYLELAKSGIDGSIIHASGDIEFAQPVREAIVAVSSFDGHQGALDELRARGKVRLNLTTHVIVDGASSSRFDGVYVVRLNRAAVSPDP